MICGMDWMRQEENSYCCNHSQNTHKLQDTAIFEEMPVTRYLDFILFSRFICLFIGHRDRESISRQGGRQREREKKALH